VNRRQYYSQSLPPTNWLLRIGKEEQRVSVNHGIQTGREYRQKSYRPNNPGDFFQNCKYLQIIQQPHNREIIRDYGVIDNSNGYMSIKKSIQMNKICGNWECE
jgi:hypothetical protein